MQQLESKGIRAHPSSFAVKRSLLPGLVRVLLVLHYFLGRGNPKPLPDGTQLNPKQPKQQQTGHMNLGCLGWSKFQVVPNVGSLLLDGVQYATGGSTKGRFTLEVKGHGKNLFFLLLTLFSFPFAFLFL